ncbi:hypothetical protein CJO80_27160 (plasmid) [Ralstonia solanacearum]|nr:hypothetical protein CJO80_27160 [Ralstonia solanacearum]
MRLTKAIRDKVTHGGETIGQMEALAGLEQDHAFRFKFWRECDAIARERNGSMWADPTEVVEVARERCHAMTFARIERGDLCMIGVREVRVGNR